MIEFDGYISGNAEKYFFIKEFICVVLCCLIPNLVFLLFSFLLGMKTGFWFIFKIVASMYLIIPIVCGVLLSIKKSRKKMLTKKIIIDDDLITAVTDTQALTKNLSDVKQVKEYLDFYAISFRIGNISNIFICQKDLLVKGTLDEFDELFIEKLVLKIK